MSARASVLEVENLNVWYGREQPVQIVHDVSFALRAGERLGLVGPSGCGKSTIVLATMGLLSPDATIAGEVRLNGSSILGCTEEVLRAKRWTELAMVFQSSMSCFNPVLTIGRQIGEAVGPRVERSARTIELLEMVGLPAHVRQRYPHELSGGMRQRAALAMALAQDPQVLLADEPTTALDVIVQAQILDLLVDLCERLGLALILVTHDLAVVDRACHHLLVMQEGHVIESGELHGVLSAPQAEYTQALVGSMLRSRRLSESTVSVAVGAPPKPTTVPARTYSTTTANGHGPAPKQLLEVRDLEVEFAVRRSLLAAAARRSVTRLRAVDGVSFELYEGEILALVGESGSGKTTTGQAVLGLREPRAGSIRIEGRELSELGRGELQRLRRHAQVVYQDPYDSLDPRFRVKRIVEEPLVIHRLAGSRKERRARVNAALETVGLSPAEHYLDRYPHELSGGQRQRVALASSMTLDVRLLVADEPVSMLDVEVRRDILDVFRRLRDAGLGVLMITHDMATVADYADRVAVMYLGRIVETGPAREVIEAPRHPYTRALIEIAQLARADDVLAPRTSFEPPSLANVPQGCRFHPRCPFAHDRCLPDEPPLRPVGTSRAVRCVLDALPVAERDE